MRVLIEKDAEAVAREAADIFARLARQAQAEGRRFRVALSGGSTPRVLYRILSSEPYRDRIDWRNIQFFFGDERWVPHYHKESNYKLAADELFARVDVDPNNIYPIPTEGVSPEEAARRYERTLREVFGVEEGEVPRFDLILLGMGDDGHTASLFPHTDVLHERERLVASPYVPKLDSYRITLTPDVLNLAEEVVFMVAGEGKAPALHEVLEGDYNIEEYPSQLSRNAKGKVTWLVDRAAASESG